MGIHSFSARRGKLQILFFLLLLGATQSVSAIVNMEELHFSTVKSENKGAFSLSYSGAKGNEDRSRLGLGMSYRMSGDNSANLISANVVRGESNGVRDSNNAFAHLRHIREFSEINAWEIFTQVEKNEFTRLNLRSLIGGGVRHRIGDAERYRQFLGLGLFYSIEKLDEAKVTNEDAEQRYTRVNFYSLNRIVWSDTSKLYFTVYAQPAVNEWDDYRLLGIVSLKVAVDNNIKLSISYNITHDSKPPELVRETDVRYLTGIEFEF